MPTSMLRPGDTVLVRATVREVRDKDRFLVAVTAKELIDVDIVRGVIASLVSVPGQEIIEHWVEGEWHQLHPGEICRCLEYSGKGGEKR